MKRTAPGLSEKESPYPNGLLMVAISLAVSVYILWPFPDEPFFKLLTHHWFLHSFSVIFTIAVAQVWLIFIISDWLDEKYRWDKKFYHRILGQVLTGWIVPVAVSAFISWFWFRYLQADIHSIRYAYNRYMFKAIMDIAMILNLIYLACSIGWFLKMRLKEEEKELGKPSFADHLYLQIPDGKEEIKVQVNEIAYLCRQGKGTMLRAYDGRAFIFWESLDKLEKQLDPHHFSRVSRTYIITRKAVRSWQRQADRGIHLELEPKTALPVKISRDKAALVISWLKSEQKRKLSSSKSPGGYIE
ncbi:LytTR family DNA-binding domain-containing protein [Mucilaginibacter sp.]|uniref:LytR/AlgR family response regulator transcription factor n=1 Tax=Mucilaginibacter sp. TaxID=1882438 RepID=UPI00284A4E3B|nr:LytTR family DNA-binding domain-containing protein [Mucilaginibacter sp.]MDR3697705.1 LytTR family DNA-binding domain-containing protein [Mucilaginibacter sp.]